MKTRLGARDCEDQTELDARGGAPNDKAQHLVTDKQQHIYAMTLCTTRKRGLQTLRDPLKSNFRGKDRGAHIISDSIPLQQTLSALHKDHGVHLPAARVPLRSAKSQHANGAESCCSSCLPEFLAPLVRLCNAHRTMCLFARRRSRGVLDARRRDVGVRRG